MTAQYQIPISGDILLVKSAQKKSRILAKAQRPVAIFGKEPSRYSHVALCLLNGIFIHSNDKGVHLSTLREIVDEINDNWVALRHVDIEEIYKNDFYLVYKRCAFYFGQKYNYQFSFRVDTKDETSFCSEMVSKVYRDLGVRISNKPPKKTWPVHIQDQAKLPQWNNVSEIYKKYLRLIDQDTEAIRFTEETLCLFQKSEMINNLMNDFFMRLKEIDRKKGMEIKKNFPQTEEVFPFWNTKRKK